MNANLQPIVVDGQQLIVAINSNIIHNMLNEKEQFSKRLNELCDEAGIPPIGKARQTTVAKIFMVSQEAARKWLGGLGLPELERSIGIAKHFNAYLEWLLTGRGPKYISTAAENGMYVTNAKEKLVVMAMEKMGEYQKDTLIKISHTLAEPEGENGPKQATQ